MKKPIPTYLVDSFTDYAGNERKFVACALSYSPQNTYEIINVEPDSYIENVMVIDRVLSFGIAICHPDDEFNLEIGKEIAYGKALKQNDRFKIYVPCESMISKDLAEAFIKQQVKFFKNDPELFIKGYNNAKNKYIRNKHLVEQINNFTSEELLIFQLASKNFDFDKYIRIAKEYANLKK